MAAICDVAMYQSTKNHAYVIMSKLPPLYPVRKGGVSNMEPVLSFIVAVAAGVACHYIIKWLDGDK